MYKYVATDLGTTFTKDSQGNVYPSGVSEIIYPNASTLTVDGKKYSMELNTGIDININKGLNKNTRINFLYSLAKMSNYQDTFFENVFVGLPASQWKKMNTVEEFKYYLFPHDCIKVELNGYEIILQVENIDVLPEGSSAYYAKDMQHERFEGRKVLILDWGGLTVNETLFNNDNFIDCHTEELGILKPYQKMAEKITSEIGKNINYLDMFDILRNGLSLNGQKIDITPIISPIALQSCEELYRSLELRWGVSTISFVVGVGASCITMYKYLKEFIPNIELAQNPQTIAVQGMIDMVEVI
jgi:hypothetical protein